MPEVAVYAPGTPCYVDLSSPDVEKSKAFYTKLFGWEAKPAQGGGYHHFLQAGKYIAGLGPSQDSGKPASWATYIATEKADETARRVKEAGGKVMAGPFDVFTSGRMAVFQDPTGAFFSVWQAREFSGSELVNEPGSIGWNELQTRDMDKAKAFYPKVFGWEARDSVIGDGGAYTEWLLNGKRVGGGIQMGANFPPDLPSNWLTYFWVANADSTVKKAEELGGTTFVPPTTIPQGRFAVLSDPQGAVFAVFPA